MKLLRYPTLRNDTTIKPWWDLLTPLLNRLRQAGCVKFNHWCGAMTRQKKTSSVLEKAELRILGFRSIDPNLNFGDIINLNQLAQFTEQLRNQLNQYNMLLTELDSAKAEMEAMEKIVRETSERMVSGVAAKYGKDSREYEMAGSVRKSDRVRKATVTRLKSTIDTTRDSPSASKQTA